MRINNSSQIVNDTNFSFTLAQRFEMLLRYKKFDSVEPRRRKIEFIWVFPLTISSRVIPQLIRWMQVISHFTREHFSRNSYSVYCLTRWLSIFFLFSFFFRKYLNTHAMIQAISICAWMWPVEETFPWKQLLVLLHVFLYLVAKDTPCFYTYLLVFLCDASKVDSRGFFFSPGLFLDSFLFETVEAIYLTELLSEHFK